MKFPNFGPFLKTKCYGLSKTHEDEHFAKKHIKIRWKIIPNVSVKKSYKKMNIKHSHVYKIENTLLSHWASCLEMGMATIPQINPNHNSVSMIIVLKFQKDW